MPPSEQERALSSQPTRPPETSSSERRRTPRAKPPGLSYVKLEPDNGGRLLDVCESGIGFQVVAPIEETKRIQLWFVLDSANHIEVSGELAWIDDTKRSGGLKFTRPSKQARQQLRAWLSHQRTESANDHQPEPTRPAPAAQSQHLSHESEFERELHSLPHTDPAPLREFARHHPHVDSNLATRRPLRPPHSTCRGGCFSPPAFRPRNPSRSRSQRPDRENGAGPCCIGAANCTSSHSKFRSSSRAETHLRATRGPTAARRSPTHTPSKSCPCARSQPRKLPTRSRAP